MTKTLFVCFSLLFFCCQDATVDSFTASDGKIPVTGEHVYQNNITMNPVQVLFDGKLNESYLPGYGGANGQLKNTEPHRIVILFPKQWNAIPQKIRIYPGEFGSDYEGKPTKYFLQRRDNGQLVEIASVTSLPYQQWAEYNVSDVTPPFIADKLVIIGGGPQNGGGKFYGAEMEIIGNYEKETPGSYSRTHQPLKNMFGSNGFWWDVTQDPFNPSVASEIYPSKISRYEEMGLSSYRLYMDWANMEPLEGKYAFEPTKQGWFSDKTMKGLKDAGIEPIVTIMGMPPALFNTWPQGQGAQYFTPVKHDRKDARDVPASYPELAKISYIMAGRWGRNASVPDQYMGTPYSHKAINAAEWYVPDNAIKKGLNLVRYIEVGNENDRNWADAYAYSDAYKLAAMMSAAYDGHKGTIDIGFGPGKGVGIKNADTSMKVVFNGLSSSNPEVMRGVWDWSREHRGLLPDGSVNLPFDIINYHKYSNNAGLGGQYDPITCGMPLELSEAMNAASSFVRFSNEYASGKEVWLSEWGYDYHPQSTYAPPAIGSRSRMEVGAAWTIRSMLLYASLGLDRLVWFKTYDDDPTKGQFFSTMSLLDTDNGKFTFPRRPVGDFMAQLKQFKDYRYDATISTSPYVLRLKNDQGSIIHAVWAVETPFNQTEEKYISWSVKPVTTKGFKENTGTYNLKVPANALVRVYEFQKGTTVMKTSDSQAVGAIFRVNYGMVPVIIEVNPVQKAGSAR
jgi:hypothetical protein